MHLRKPHERAKMMELEREEEKSVFVAQTSILNSALILGGVLTATSTVSQGDDRR